ncbi:ankyrin repeat domain-containing protein 53 isoform X1 [Gadus chalcogrammus]|uniref:ankyrin repeat domain-containing protein 53 isoform X1 n=1 Tax=Gadus chalcogrammus TaxID=1042646 RepID=UPI0024C4AEB0|nr:ankyrin repeat domain-containing protein 53 isoform X1 [Gadus chalcogrammus]
MSRALPKDDQFKAAAAGDPEWLTLSLKHAVALLDTDEHGVSALHVACLHGQLTCVKLLLESGLVDINGGCGQGRRPVHMVLSTQSSPNTSACLEYLLDRGADVNVSTTSAVTPLHSAAAEGMLACTKMLVRARADVHACDKNGHTPLDMARSYCHRLVARYLKDCMWKANKKRELEMKRQVQILYRDLVLMSKLDEGREKTRRRALIEKKTEEWASRKGLGPPPDPPASSSLVSQFHRQCLLSEPPESRPKPRAQTRAQQGDPRQRWNTSTHTTRSPPPPPTSVSKPPQAVRMDDQPTESPSPEPDLRGWVTLSKATDGGHHHEYTTRWESSPCRAPDLPLDALERGLFPRAFPGRMASPRDYRPWSILDQPRLGVPPGQGGASPWTEVALHLPDVLEPGHY